MKRLEQRLNKYHKLLTADLQRLEQALARVKAIREHATPKRPVQTPARKSHDHDPA
jgi:hypothetical protein